MPDDEGEAGGSEKFWIVFTAIMALITVMVGGYAVYDQRENTRILKETLDKLRNAENANEGLKSSLNAANSEIEALSKLNLDKFLYAYELHINSIKAALEDYQSAKRLNEGDRAGALSAAQGKLFAAVDDFVGFIEKWRLVAARLDALLDGNVSRMEEARRRDNADDVQSSAETLIRAFPDLEQPLRLELEKVRAMKPPG
jgi:hypothetical protein